MKILFLAFLTVSLLAPVSLALARDDPGQITNPFTGSKTNATSNPCAGGGYNLGVQIGDTSSVPKGADAFRCYVLAWYKYILGLSVILATIICTWAGYIWLTSGGDPAKITHARELIIGALSGLALLILASTLLKWIGVN